MAFLQYLYTDHCPIDEGEATSIMVLANQYCVNRLKALCELYISKTVEKATEVSIANSELSVIGRCAYYYSHDNVSCDHTGMLR